MATYVDLANAINRIRALLPNIGNIYFVDTDAGVNAANRGTYALPLKTIDYAISNYVTDYNGDVVMCWGSAGGDFDENANVDGVEVDKNNTTIIAFNMPKIDNSNGGATSIFHVTAQSCRIWGFACVPTVPIIGIHCDSLFTVIGSPEFGNGFEDCSVDVQLDGNQNLCEGNRHTSSTIGYLCTKSTQEIRNNVMMGTGAGGSIGVHMTSATPSVQNYIHDNDITNYDTGIQADNLAIKNTACRNALNNVANIDDNNIVGLNNWSGNYILNPAVTTAIDSQLTVANGIAPISIITAPPLPLPISRVHGLTLIINGAYGANSFKVNAVVGSYLEVWIDIQTPNDANWRRITESSDEYRLYQSDTLDCLIIDDVTASTIFRVRAALSIVPNATIDLDWQLLFEVN